MTKDKDILPRPTRDQTLMDVAKVISKRGTCLRLKCGAVLAKGGRVLATGYNGSPPKQPHCLDDGCILDVTQRCVRTIHAEINVVLMAARYGITTEGATLFCTSAPCPNCSKLLTNLGLVRVVYEKLYHNQYTTSESVSILTRAGIKVDRFNPKS